MSSHPYTLRMNVWLYPGAVAWHFVTIPKRVSRELRDRFEGMTRGWGSLPVSVTIGNTTWNTSIFPDSKMGAYLLPLKAEVRKKENIKERDTITALLTVRI